MPEDERKLIEDLWYNKEIRWGSKFTTDLEATSTVLDESPQTIAIIAS